jgi:zinc/manganese transport system substrate-binding protein
MNRKRFTLLALAGLVFIPGMAVAKIRVAASINDLASIANSVGGENVECFAIARPKSDVHRVDVLPSYMVKVSRADIYLKVGLGLDQWADGIIDGSRNSHLHVIDCSMNVPVLEKPTGTVTALQGDVHPFGNPHYWLDPRNAAPVARTIAEALADEDPEHADFYRANAEAVAKQAEECYARNRALADGLPNKNIITYHRSWTYFANAFGITVAGECEPVPGIPPTGKHLAELVDIAKSHKIILMLQEPYFSADAGQFLARETGLRAVVESPSCETAEAGSYLAHFDRIMGALAGAKAGS